MKVNLWIVALILIFSSCTDKNFKENVIIQKPLSQYEPYYGSSGNASDSLLWPLITDLELYVENIQGLETNKQNFRLAGTTASYIPLTKPYVDYEGDTIFDPSLDYLESNIIYDNQSAYYESDFLNFTFFMEEENDRLYYKSDSLLQRTDRFDGMVFHNWNLSKYPFDTQNLRYSFQSFIDTSQMRLRSSKLFPSSFNLNNDLQQGFKIEKIEFKEEFIESPFYSDLLNRKEVFSLGVFNIIISRSGSWIFIKLFFGGILALVLSWLVFIIPLRDFSSRIELSIGAVFAAVGNKYFVDSAIDSQILTVADLFNNIIIFMVVLNVGLIIMKRNAVFKNKLINDTKTVSKISIYTALVLFSLLTIYTIT